MENTNSFPEKGDEKDELEKMYKEQYLSLGDMQDLSKGKNTWEEIDSRRQNAVEKRLAITPDDELVHEVDAAYTCNYVYGCVSVTDIFIVNLGLNELDARGYEINFIKKPFIRCGCPFPQEAIDEEDKMKRLRQDLCPDCGEKPIIEQKQILDIKKPIFPSSPEPKL